ncbi:hypothetical protein T439DRAFT_354151 [Meredithblackwellia eburnea MCA 4105]
MDYSKFSQQTCILCYVEFPKALAEIDPEKAESLRPALERATECEVVVFEAEHGGKGPRDMWCCLRFHAPVYHLTRSVLDEVDEELAKHHISIPLTYKGFTTNVLKNLFPAYEFNPTKRLSPEILELKKRMYIQEILSRPQVHQRALHAERMAMAEPVVVGHSQAHPSPWSTFADPSATLLSHDCTSLTGMGTGLLVPYDPTPEQRKDMMRVLNPGARAGAWETRQSG